MPTKYAPQARYDAAHTVKVTVKLNRRTDADLIAALDAAPKQTLIKQALRAYLRKENTMNRYSFKELLSAALSPAATDADLPALAEWCDRYGSCWNGEAYDISDEDQPSGSRMLYPVYREIREDEFEISGYEIR